MAERSPTIVVTGSIASDHLMTFPGRFADSLLADSLASVSLSFLVDDLVVRRGGTAANIAYGLAQLGPHAILVGAAGADFAPHRDALERTGVDCSGVLTVPDDHTARFVCTTDTQFCQLASFYPGAMRESGRIDLAAVVGDREPPDLVIIAPDTPEAMLRHAAACRARGWPYAADPSQQLALMTVEQIREFITGARYLFTNEYEHALLCRRLGIPADRLTAAVDVVVTTRGASGVTIGTGGGDVDVPAVPLARAADPTGSGDAFRAGFCAAVTRFMSLRDAGAAGCLLASRALAAPGGQEYAVTERDFAAGLAEHYGISWADIPVTG